MLKSEERPRPHSLGRSALCAESINQTPHDSPAARDRPHTGAPGLSPACGFGDLCAGYEIVGPRGAPVIAVLGGISASKHVTSSASDPSPGWWEDVVGPGRAIDTRQFRVLGIDYVTSGKSTAPVTTADQAEALAAALDQAGVRSLHAVVGASYGGMVALAFGVAFAARARRLIVISAAHESDPIATALRHLQRRVVALGSAVGRERDGLAIARGIAMTSYLTPSALRGAPRRV